MAIQAASLIVHVGGDVSEAQSALNQASKSVDNFAKKAGQSMTGVGAAMTAGITLPVVAGIKSIADAGIGFESAFAGVRKTVDGTEADFARLETGIRAMAKEIPATATEIAGVAEAAGQLGIQTDAILGFTRVMIDLGNATNLSSERAAMALARLANITQMPQDQFEQLGNVIVHLGNNLATTESEIVEMGLRIAAAGHQVGLTEGQILAFAATLSSLGIEAQAGGTAISRVMIEMAKEVATGGERLEQFADVAGLSVGEFTRLFQEDATEAIIRFVEGLADASAAGENFYGILEEMGLNEIRVRDALGRLTGSGDLFRQSLELQNEALREGNALQVETAQRYQTTASQLQMLRNRITDLGISIFQQYKPAIMDLLDSAVGLVDRVEEIAMAFTRLPAPVQAAVLGFVGMAAVVGPLLVAFGGLAIVIGSVGAPVLALSAAMVGLGAVAAVVVVEWDRINALFPEIADAAHLGGEALALFGRIALEVFPAIAVGAEASITLIIGHLKFLMAGLTGVGKVISAILRRDFGELDDIFTETSQRLQDASKMMMGALDPILSPREFMRGMDEWRDRLDGLVDGFGKGTTSATEFGEALDQVGQQSGFESTGMEEFIASMQAGEQAVANLAAGIDAVHVINLSWNNSVAEAGAHVSHWEGMLSSAESALDILNKQVESGIPLNAEQQKQYDALTWATGRYAGGVADQQQAFVDAEAQRAIYNQGLDDLNQQFIDGKLNQDQYARAAAELAESIDPAIVSQENMRSATETLYGHIEDLVGAVHDLMVGLGLIPPTVDSEITADTSSANEAIDGFIDKAGSIKPEPIEFSADTDAAVRAVSAMNEEVIETAAKPVTINVDTLAAMNSAHEVQTRVDEIAQSEPIKITVDIAEALNSATEMQTAVDEITQTTPIPIDADNLAAMNSAHEVQAGIDGIVQGALPTIDADNSPALGSISTVQSSLNGLTDHTITIYANIAPFEAGIQTARNQLPSSPAKEGPFSKEPDWAWVFEGMPDAAARASSRATEIASAIITGMSADTSRIGELAGFVDDRVALQLSRQYQELGDDLQDAILSGADEETRVKLQSELDAAGALLARWSEETGRTIEQLVGVATDERNWIDAQQALQDLFGTISGRTQDIISGGYITDLKDQLQDLRTELILLEGIDAPEIVLQGVRDQIGETIRELELAGQIYGEAVRRGMVASFEQSQREAGFWSFLVDSLDDLVSGGLVERLTQDVADLQRDIAILSLAGAPQAIIDELTAEMESKEDQLARIGTIIQDGIAAGIIDDPNAITPISDAILSQIRAISPTLAGAGEELSKPLTDAFLAGRLTADQFMSMFPTDVLRDSVLPELERLEDRLTVDLVEAMLTGADGVDELNAKLQLLAELLGLIKSQAAAVSFDDGFLITGPGAGEVGSQGQGHRPRYGPVAAGYVAPSSSSSSFDETHARLESEFASAQRATPQMLTAHIYLPSGDLWSTELAQILEDERRRPLN